MENERKKPTWFFVTAAGLLVVAIALAFYFGSSPQEPIGDVDGVEVIDLTVMNSTMVYAYVNDMVNTRPEDYLGKTVKAKGEHYLSYYDVTDAYYHFVIISDATACCAQGLEFFFEGDYPSEGIEIVVTGTFASYVELDITYYYIDAASVDVA